MAELRVALFVSRNKDNKNIKSFKERKHPFLTSKSINELMNKFECFLNAGVNGEVCRFYISVNDRNHKKVYKSLLHYLIDNPNIKLESIEGKISSLASKNENRNSKYFLLDCDVDTNEFKSILKYLDNLSVTIIEYYKTPNGFGIITNGFDTRQLLELYPDIQLKRDGLKFITSSKKGVSYGK